MKSQDLLLMLKLASIQAHKPDKPSLFFRQKAHAAEWEGWDIVGRSVPPQTYFEAPIFDERVSVRGLQLETGISKSEVSAGLRRCEEVGLIKQHAFWGEGVTVNTKSLYEFLSYGIRYVFPVRPGPLARGIPTAAYAPVFNEKLFAGSDSPLVWADPKGSSYGQEIEPIYKTVPHAVRRDPTLYALLALVDSIRVGNEREVSLARKLLEKYLGRKSDD